MNIMVWKVITTASKGARKWQGKTTTWIMLQSQVPWPGNFALGCLDDTLEDYIAP